MNSLGTLYRKTHRSRNAEGIFGQAADIYRTLALKSPNVFGDQLAESLRNIAELAFKADPSRACTLAREAMQVADSADQRALVSTIQQRCVGLRKRG